MLETYDPKWPEKWERAQAIMRELEIRESSLTADERDQLNKLRLLLPVVYDAGHRTANDYIRFQLSLTLKEADQLGIWAWLPSLPDHAGIDAARAAISEVVTYIDTVKHRRETFAICRRADMTPTYVRPLPKLTWRTRLAMLRFRLGREWRCRRYQPVPGA